MRQSLGYGMVASLVFFLAALGVGVVHRPLLSTLSLIGTSIVLEAQPAAVASIPLGFHPLTGAMVSILANLIPIPLIMLTFHEIVRRWKWVNRRLQKAEKWSHKYGRYGVWVLVPLTAIIGAYLCIAIGFGMRWKPWLIFIAMTIGMAGSTLLITYGGHWIVNLFA